MLYDVYALEFVKPSEFLDQDPNNVSVQVDKELIGIDRRHLAVNKQSTFWSCVPPLRKYTKLPLRDAIFVNYSEMERVLKHDIRKIVLVFDHVEERLQSNDVYGAKLGAGVSGKHCQSTSGERVYRVSAATLRKIATSELVAKPKRVETSSSSQSASAYARKYDIPIPTADLFDKSGRLNRRLR